MSQFTENDQVFKFYSNGKINVGLVLQTAEDDFSDIDEHCSFCRLEQGNIRVIWYPSGVEATVHEKEVAIADRDIMPGSLVQRVLPNGVIRRGVCKKADVNAFAKIMFSNKVLYNVDHERCEPLDKYSAEILVVFDSWIGIAKKAYSTITLLTKDGSKCIYPDVYSCPLRTVDSHTKGSFTSHKYYPGQITKGPLIALEIGHWVTCTDEMHALRIKKDRKQKFLVKEITVEKIAVHWLGQILKNNEVQKPQPNKIIEGDDMKRMKEMYLVKGHPQLGERFYFTLNESDKIHHISEWDKHIHDKYTGLWCDLNKKWAKNTFEMRHSCSELVPESITSKESDCQCFEDGWDSPSEDNSNSEKPKLCSKCNRKRKRLPVLSNPKPGDKVILEVLHTATKVDVLWQDGTYEPDIPARTLEPIKLLDPQDFFCGDLVVRENSGSTDEDYGIVQTVDNQARTAVVRWFKKFQINENPAPHLLYEVEVSLYELKDNPEMPLRIGVIVVPTDFLRGNKDDKVVGQVSELHTSGKISVQWITGQTTDCWPQELKRVSKDSDSESFVFSTSSEDSWITETTDVSRFKVLYAHTGHSADNLDARITIVMNQESTASAPDIPQLIEKRTMEHVIEITTLLQDLKEILKNKSSFDYKQCIKMVYMGYKQCCLIDNILETNFFERSLFNDLLKVLKKEKETISQDISSPPNLETAKNMHELLNIQFEEAIKEFKKLNDLLVVESTDTRKITRVDNYFKISLGEIENIEVDNEEIIISEDRREEISETINEPGEFSILDAAPAEHRYFASVPESAPPREFFKAVKKEHDLMTHLPPGVWVRAFSDRSDLYAIMIAGPKDTPYESGLFLFDVQLNIFYPKYPPQFCYISYCTDRMNPNLYEDGKVCVSLLGTWPGSGVEVWGRNSNLLQVILSIQGLILNSEPYFNEAGYELHKSTKQGSEPSRVYNEMVMLKMVQSITRMLKDPYPIFTKEILQYLKRHIPDFVQRLEAWTDPNYDGKVSKIPPPKFPLLPISKGLRISIKPNLIALKAALESVISE